MFFFKGKFNEKNVSVQDQEMTNQLKIKLNVELVHVCFFTLPSVTLLWLSFDNTASTTWKH